MESRRSVIDLARGDERSGQVIKRRAGERSGALPDVLTRQLWCHQALRQGRTAEGHSRLADVELRLAGTSRAASQRGVTTGLYWLGTGALFATSIRC